MARSTSSDETPKGLHDSKPLAASKIVGDYPERPYGDAVTDEHRKELEALGIEVPKKSVVDPTLAPPDA